MSSQSLSQSWSDFFKRYFKYIRPPTSENSLTNGERWRGFLNIYFSHSTKEFSKKSLIEQTLHEVYVREGDYAYQQSMIMEFVIDPSLKKLKAEMHPVETPEQAIEAGESALQALLYYVETLAALKLTINLGYFTITTPSALFGFAPGIMKMLNAIHQNAKLTVPERETKFAEIKESKRVFIEQSIRNFLIERIIAEHLSQEFAERDQDPDASKYILSDKYLEFKARRSSETLTEMLEMIEMRYPIIAWDGFEGVDTEWPLRRAVADSIKRRVQWELSNPGKEYTHYYIPPDSDFFELIISSSLYNQRIFSTDTKRDRRMTLTPRMHMVAMVEGQRRESAGDEMVKPTPQHSFFPSGFLKEDKVKNNDPIRRTSVLREGQRLKENVVRSEVSLAHTVPFPRFRNLIGFSLLHPAYILDTLGHVVFGNLLKWSLLSFRAYNAWSGQNEDAFWLKNFVRCLMLFPALLAIASLLARTMMFGIPKIAYEIKNGASWIWKKYFHKKDNTALVAYESDPSIESHAGSKMTSAPHTPKGALGRQATQFQESAVVRLSTHQYVHQQTEATFPHHVSVPSIPLLDLNVSKVQNARDETAPDEKLENNMLQITNRKNNLDLPSPGSRYADGHSRTRNRFTFTFRRPKEANTPSPESGQMHPQDSLTIPSDRHSPRLPVPSPSPKSDIGMNLPNQPFVVEVNKSPSLHAHKSSLWEGDFPEQIVVTNAAYQP